VGRDGNVERDEDAVSNAIVQSPSHYSTFMLNRATFTVLCVSDSLLPIVEIVPLQLFAYHDAILNNYDLDKPRNLMRSVCSDRLGKFSAP